MITLRELRRQLAKRLSIMGDDAAYEADLLIEKVYGLSPSELITKSANELDENVVEPLVKRRLSGEPVQYILGEWEFYGLPFYVGEGVLIPRQDTECLVERALMLIKDKKAPRVLELCSGSGCIAVALAHCRPDAVVTAVDFYGAPIDYMERNAELNGVRIDIRRFDVLREPEGFGEYDLIVANPPYITAHDMSSLQAEVTFEPQTALFGGDDGLVFYKAIAKNWLPLLADGGSYAVEIGYNQGEAVADIFRSHGMNATCEQDLNRVDRVIYGTENAV